jgi:hypothetical protein
MYHTLKVFNLNLDGTILPKQKHQFTMIGTLYTSASTSANVLLQGVA